MHFIATRKLHTIKKNCRKYVTELFVAIAVSIYVESQLIDQRFVALLHNSKYQEKLHLQKTC